MVLLLSESAVVYPKELARDDFATAPAARAVEVDRFRHGYSQIPPLHSAHFLFAKYIIRWSGAINGKAFMRYVYVYTPCHMHDIPEDIPPGF